MSFNALDAAMGATLMQALGEPVAYKAGVADPVSIYAEIDVDVEVFGESESGVAEYRTEIAMLIADVGQPVRGDTITTAASVVYTVQDILSALSDKVEVRVSAK